MLTKTRASVLAAAALAVAGYFYQPPTTPAPVPLLSAPTAKVTTLGTWDGQHYASAQPDGTLVADRTKVGAWEEFKIEPHGARIALLGAHGFYVSAQPDGTVEVNRKAANGWEMWTLVPTDGGTGLQSDFGTFLVAEGGGGGAVNANRTDLGPWETFKLAGGAPGPGPVVSLKPLRPSESGRWLRTDDGLFDWREVSAFSLQSRMLRGEAESHVRPLLRQWRGLGFTVTRVMLTLGGDYWEGRAGSPINYSLRSCPDAAGYFEKLDALLDMHAQEGLRTRLTLLGALECFGGVWDPQARRDIYQGEVRRKAEAFAMQVVERVRSRPYVQIELANEPAAIGMRDSSRALRDLGRRVRAAWPGVVLNLGDVNGMDFADAFDGAFNTVDRHVDRNAGLRFIEADKRMGEDAYRDEQPRAMPAISGEPKNMGELRKDGRNGDVATAPVSAYAYAAVTRSRQILPNFHYDDGLWTSNIPIKPETVRSMQAYHQALNAFPMVEGNRYRGHWSEAQGNWWKRDPYPASDDIREIERHIANGRGPWRVFGVGDWVVVFPFKPGLDPLKWAARPGDVRDRYADDLYEVAIVQKR